MNTEFAHLTFYAHSCVILFVVLIVSRYYFGIPIIFDTLSLLFPVDVLVILGFTLCVLCASSGRTRQRYDVFISTNPEVVCELRSCMCQGNATLCCPLKKVLHHTNSINLVQLRPKQKQKQTRAHRIISFTLNQQQNSIDGNAAIQGTQAHRIE